ncbi:MAG: hypothetical protein JOZ52_07175 [Acidobacteria bacterium]|nr:hypothetical protein [Acidobacteriota bacterium]
MNKHSTSYHLITAVLQVALVFALAAGAWSIYRQLPDERPDASAREAEAETSLQIFLREPQGMPAVPLNIPVALYPIDIAAAQNEFFSERRPGKRLDDFLAERMGNRSPVESRFDEHGQLTIKVKSGPWWIHATLLGELNIEWRLRVNVSGQRQTVELTPDNAYTRTKSF